METSQRAVEILSLAKQSAKAKQGTWFARLADEDREVLGELRNQWQANRDAFGISAAQLARTIAAEFPGRKLPGMKDLAEWLNRPEPPRS